MGKEVLLKESFLSVTLVGGDKDFLHDNKSEFRHFFNTTNLSHKRHFKNSKINKYLIYI